MNKLHLARVLRAFWMEESDTLRAIWNIAGQLPDVDDFINERAQRRRDRCVGAANATGRINSFPWSEYMPCQAFGYRGNPALAKRIAKDA